METLFNDSEIFTKQRPTKLTEKQEEELYLKLAQEIIDEKWSSSDIEDIIHDLKELSRHDNGYELAKKLEGFSSLADYDIDTQFIEWLDDFDYYHQEIIDNNQKAWVKAHDIKPLYEIGTELLINENLIYRLAGYQKGDRIFVNGYYEETGKYLISSEKGSRQNYIVNYEKVENNCQII